MKTLSLILFFLASVATAAPYDWRVTRIKADGVNQETVNAPPPVYIPVGVTLNDGVDDRAAIQAAIDTCSAAGGGDVFLGEGDWRVQPVSGIAILLPSNVRLRGTKGTNISTDNTAADANYNVIAPLGYNTATSPYSAAELYVEDLTISCTAHTGGSPNDRLHNLIAVVHSPRARIRRVGFVSSRTHFAEVNSSRDVLFEDCYTSGVGNHGFAKFQLDSGGLAGQASASASVTSAISNSATHASGTQTLLTVAATAAFKVDDVVVITGANGASSASYNAAGGFRVTQIPGATTIAINLAWPGNATTAGTLAAKTPVDGVAIIRYKDKAAADTGVEIGKTFLELTHTSLLGVYRNITVDGCEIVPTSFSVAPTTNYLTIGVDNGAYPMELTNVQITNNVFRDGGHTGLTTMVDVHVPYDATYAARRVSGINISNNSVVNCGMYHFARWGDSPDDTIPRASIAATAVQTHRNIVVSGNNVYPILRGSAATAVRPSRIFRGGSAENVSCTNNYILFPDVAPSNLHGLSWTASLSSQYGFFFDHPRSLICEGNHVEVRLRAENAGLNLQGFVVGMSAYEVASLPANISFRNNTALGFGSIGTNLAHGFLEVNASGTFLANWANPRSPFVRGVWSGNRAVSGGTLTTDTWSTNFASLNTPADVITGSDTSVTEAATWGWHNWSNGQPVVQEFSNAAVTVNPDTTILLQRGTMSASRVVTLPPASLSQFLAVADSSGSVTGTNTLVLTRAGSDTINGATTLTLNSAYGATEIVSDKTLSWTQIP